MLTCNDTHREVSTPAENPPAPDISVMSGNPPLPDIRVDKLLMLSKRTKRALLQKYDGLRTVGSYMDDDSLSTAVKVLVGMYNLDESKFVFHTSHYYDLRVVRNRSISADSEEHLDENKIHYFPIFYCRHFVLASMGVDGEWSLWQSLPGY